ncbi:MAG: 16S rRNA (uracil(1498)-N(3))-methyltransferase [Methylococcaceae bacterium]|nr:MAG: 16S rRNA (uracil(1498)-N(3))-methyltransferase [Methylococcaceae bacterium]
MRISGNLSHSASRRLSRLHVNFPLSAHSEISADEAVAHYVRDVLRLRKGDAVCLFDGQGGEYEGLVLEVSRHSVRLDVGVRRERDSESPLHTELGLGISRGERMDYAVQKAVELGASRIVPLSTEHAVVRLSGDKRAQRRLHWQKIAIAACEQSGRCRVPEIAEPMDLSVWLAQQSGLRLYCDPRAAQGLLQLAPPGDQRVTLLSGPEGGFSGDERSLAQGSGFLPVKLGPRVLRTETAALTILAAVQMLWGDLG